MDELRKFFHALRFLTVLPAPDAPSIEPDWLIRCAKYFPLIGVLVGLVSAIVLLLAGAVWGGVLPALLAVAASIIVTGALHEDGLADTADGFGGGRTRESRLTIMKDSRLGTYGALALGFGVAARVAALSMVAPWVGAAALIAAHAGGRVAAGAVLALQPYAGAPSATRIVYTSDPAKPLEMVVAAAIAVAATAPLLLIAPLSAAIGIVLGALMVWALTNIAIKAIGGYTGDVLGAVEQVFEIGLLVGVAALVG